jgi:hypothetical protein
MEEESGPASWITAALPIDAVLAAYVEHPTVVRLDRRKLTRHKCDSPSIAAKPIASHSLNDTTEVDLASQDFDQKNSSPTNPSPIAIRLLAEADRPANSALP